MHIFFRSGWPHRLWLPDAGGSDKDQRLCEGPDLLWLTVYQPKRPPRGSLPLSRLRPEVHHWNPAWSDVQPPRRTQYWGMRMANFIILQVVCKIILSIYPCRANFYCAGCRLSLIPHIVFSPVMSLRGSWGNIKGICNPSCVLWVCSGISSQCNTLWDILNYFSWSFQQLCFQKWCQRKPISQTS